MVLKKKTFGQKHLIFVFSMETDSSSCILLFFYFNMSITSSNYQEPSQFQNGYNTKRFNVRNWKRALVKNNVPAINLWTDFSCRNKRTNKFQIPMKHKFWNKILAKSSGQESTCEEYVPTINLGPDFSCRSKRANNSHKSMKYKFWNKIPIKRSCL